MTSNVFAFPFQPCTPKTIVHSPLPASTSVMGSTARRVLVPIANGSEPIEAVVIVDVLRRAGADVTVASVEKQLLISANHGVKIVSDESILNCSDRTFDLVALPGGIPGAATLGECAELRSIVEKQAADGRLLAAICAAPALTLGRWGLLKGLKATCYPSYMEHLSSLGASTAESRVAKDGRVITSRGPGTSLEFSIELVEQLYGKEKADEVYAQLVMRTNHGGKYNFHEINTMKWTHTDLPQVIVPIANGTEEMEAVIIIDVLRRAKANVIVASVENELEIVASRRMKLVADVRLDDVLNLSYDLVVLPGGLRGAETFSNSEELVNLLKKQAGSGKPYGAICASPALVFEPHGLLKGKKGTAFPSLCEKLSEKGEMEKRVVVDGNLITSRGPGTAMEFSLVIVEKFFGKEKAENIAESMVFVHP